MCVCVCVCASFCVILVSECHRESCYSLMWHMHVYACVGLCVCEKLWLISPSLSLSLFLSLKQINGKESGFNRSGNKEADEDYHNASLLVPVSFSQTAVGQKTRTKEKKRERNRERRKEGKTDKKKKKRRKRERAGMGDGVSACSLCPQVGLWVM